MKFFYMFILFSGLVVGVLSTLLLIKNQVIPETVTEGTLGDTAGCSDFNYIAGLVVIDHGSYQMVDHVFEKLPAGQSGILRGDLILNYVDFQDQEFQTKAVTFHQFIFKEKFSKTFLSSEYQ